MPAVNWTLRHLEKMHSLNIYCKNNCLPEYHLNFGRKKNCIMVMLNRLSAETFRGYYNLERSRFAFIVELGEVCIFLK